MVEIKANDILNRIVEGGLYLQQNDLVEVEGTNGKTYTIDIKRVPLHNRLFTVYGKSTNKTQPSVCLEGKKIIDQRHGLAYSIFVLLDSFWYLLKQW